MQLLARIPGFHLADGLIAQTACKRTGGSSVGRMNLVRVQLLTAAQLVDLTTAAVAAVAVTMLNLSPHPWDRDINFCVVIVRRSRSGTPVSECCHGRCSPCTWPNNSDSQLSPAKPRPSSLLLLYSHGMMRFSFCVPYL